MIDRQEEIKVNYREVLERINKNGPSPSLPLLVAVTKTYPVADILTLYRCGHRDFGENRVLELKEKAFEIHSMEGGKLECHWHYLGNIQSNKIKDLLRVHGLSYIHSVDSMRTLKSLLKESSILTAKKSKVGLYLQVNTSGEKEKQGFSNYSDLKEAANYLQTSSTSTLSSDQGFYLSGLMTIGTYRTEDFESEARRCFSLLRSYRDMIGEELFRSDLKLSMGMSSDYMLALENGSDVVRIGSSLFGARI